MKNLDHHLAITDEEAIVCRKCGHELGPAGESFKSGAVCKQRPIEDANPLIVDPKTFVDDEVVFRQYYCPGCATLLENEVILERSDAVWDKKVDRAATAAGKEA